MHGTEHVLWDEGQLSTVLNHQHQAPAEKALREALTAAGWKGTDVTPWLSRLRVGGDAYFMTYAKKRMPAGDTALAAAPVAVVAPRVIHESDIERELVERLEGAAALSRMYQASARAESEAETVRRTTQNRLTAWFERPPQIRALLRLSVARPADAPLLRAIAAAFKAEPVGPNFDQYGSIRDALPAGDATY